MRMDAKPQAKPTPSYEDLHLSPEWAEDKQSQTLVIPLQGFKKEQLKALIDNHGNMKISGERQVDASSNKWVRFHKAFRVPENCNLNDIRAKFDKEILYVTLSKMTPRVVDKQDKKSSDERAPSIADAAEEAKKKTDDKLDEKQKNEVSKDAEPEAKQKMPEKQEPNHMDGGKLTNGEKMKKKMDEYSESIDGQEKRDELMPAEETTQRQQGLFALRMKRPSKKVIKIAVAAVVVVATVALAIHVYKITSQNNIGEFEED